MSRDRRGFEYALEPMRSITEWDMNDVARELAAQNAAVDAQQEKVTQLSDTLDAARSEVILQRQMQALLSIDTQRVAHAYMAQVHRKLVTENVQLQGMQQERNDTFERLNGLRKFADSLDRNKESAAEEYDQKIVKQAYLQADDSWLQRLHWRKSS